MKWEILNRFALKIYFLFVNTASKCRIVIAFIAICITAKLIHHVYFGVLVDGVCLRVYASPNQIGVDYFL